MTGRTWTLRVNEAEDDLGEDGLELGKMSLKLDILETAETVDAGVDEKILGPSAVHVYFPSSADRSMSVTVNVPFG